MQKITIYLPGSSRASIICISKEFLKMKNDSIQIGAVAWSSMGCWFSQHVRMSGFWSLSGCRNFTTPSAKGIKLDWLCFLMISDLIEEFVMNLVANNCSCGRCRRSCCNPKGTQNKKQKTCCRSKECILEAHTPGVQSQRCSCCSSCSRLQKPPAAWCSSTPFISQE